MSRKKTRRFARRLDMYVVRNRDGDWFDGDDWSDFAHALPFEDAAEAQAVDPEADVVQYVERPDRLCLSRHHQDILGVMRSLDVYQTCLRVGWERDDLEQEVAIRILARQSMASRYDPKRGGLGKYLYTNCRGILLNLIDKHARRLKREQVGMRGDDGLDCDAATQAHRGDRRG